MKAWIEPAEETRARESLARIYSRLLECTLGLAAIIQNYPDQYPSDEALMSVFVKTLHSLQDAGSGGGGPYVFADEVYSQAIAIEPDVDPDKLREMLAHHV